MVADRKGERRLADLTHGPSARRAALLSTRLFSSVVIWCKKHPCIYELEFQICEDKCEAADGTVFVRSENNRVMQNYFMAGDNVDHPISSGQLGVCCEAAGLLAYDMNCSPIRRLSQQALLRLLRAHSGISYAKMQ